MNRHMMWPISSESSHRNLSLRPGAPVVASFPHFHLADPKYVEAVGGMSPQMEHHQTFLDLNPVGHRAAFRQPWEASWSLN